MKNKFQINLSETLSFSRDELYSKKSFKFDMTLLSKQWLFLDHASNYNREQTAKTYYIFSHKILVKKLKNVFSCIILSKNLVEQNCVNPSILNEFRFYAHKKAIIIKEIEGLLFVTFNAQDAIDFDVIEQDITPLMRWHGIQKAKVAFKKSYSIQANWKSVTENLLECYHCYANHPEMCSVAIHPTITSTDSYKHVMTGVEVWKKWQSSTDAMGYPLKERTNIDYLSPQFHVIYRSPINVQHKSHSRDKSLLAPLMGSYKESDYGETFGYIGPLTLFSMPNDYAYVLRVNPMSNCKTVVDLCWLVDEKAEENKDFKLDKLIWYWDSTVAQDKIAIERAHKGTSSRFYSPGKYTKLEEESARFAIWYRKFRSDGHAL